MKFHARRLRVWISAPLLLVASACVGVDPGPDKDRAREFVLESTGRAEAFGTDAALPTEEELDAILAGGLSSEEALELTLRHNRELRAALHEVGIAHADWVQARLLTNPSLDVLLRFPTDGGRAMVEGLLGVQLLELWRLPARSRAARGELDAIVLRIARKAGEALAETRLAYFRAVAAEERLAIAHENVDLARRTYEAVRDLHELGGADAFDESLALAPLLSAQLVERTSRLRARDARRELAERLSLESSLRAVPLSDPLPKLAPADADPEALVRRSLDARLDLRAMLTAIEGLEARVELEERAAWGDVELGPSFEQPGEAGSDLVGPFFDLTLPLFDQNQAGIARARFRLEAMRELYAAARVEVAQDVRGRADRLRTALENLAFYAEELLPQAQRALALAREALAAGEHSLLAVIEVQRQVLEARGVSVDLRLEAAQAAAELERALGAPLPSLTP